MGGLIAVGAWDGREYLSETRPLLLFEPQAEAFAALCANLGHKPNVKFANCALGSEPGTATLNVSRPSHSSSLLKPKKHLDILPGIEFVGTEQVNVTTLDRMVSRFGLGGYDELVLDVQGYELEVLKGATETLRAICRITCEVNTDEVYEGCAQMDEIDNFLAPRFKRTHTDLHRGHLGRRDLRREGELMDDPAGVFASDTHRRVMANVPNPDDDPLNVEALLVERIAKDDYLELDEDELSEILQDLEADGHVKQLKDGWKNTSEGFAVLTGPIKEN